MSETAEPTAHEILATHVTNVPEVTAKVIRRACTEHQAVLDARAADPDVAAQQHWDTMRELLARSEALVQLATELKADVHTAMFRVGGDTCQKTNGRRPTTTARR